MARDIRIAIGALRLQAATPAEARRRANQFARALAGRLAAQTLPDGRRLSAANVEAPDDPQDAAKAAQNALSTEAKR